MDLGPRAIDLGGNRFIEPTFLNTHHLFMKTFFCLFMLSMILGLSGCRTPGSVEEAAVRPPKVTRIPEGSRVVTTFDTSGEFIAHVMPLSDGQSFHPSFLVFNEDSDNFSAESSEELIRYYRKIASKGNKRILLMSNHYLILWNATDRRMARGTVLQERHFSPEWKPFREEERVFIDRFIRIAAKERIEVWINEGMNWTNGTWRLMTPPFQVDVIGDVKSIRKKTAEIEAELNKVFSEALRTGKIPGVDPQSHGMADVFLPDGWQNLDSYPQKAEIRVKVEGSVDLLEYHYEKPALKSPWELKDAWRVHGAGIRTRLAVPKS